MKVKAIKLKTINDVLRKVGLVLVIMSGNGVPTKLWIESAKTYDSRSNVKLRKDV